MRRLWPIAALVLLLAGAALFRRHLLPSPSRPQSGAPSSEPSQAASPPAAAPRSAASPAEGDPAVPGMEEVPPPTPPSLVSLSLANLLRTQNADGSWGAGPEISGGRTYDRTGTTALALLAFLGAGYTYMNREEIEGIRVSEALKKALQWLQKNAVSDTLNSSIAALALLETYGMTCASMLKDSAVEALQRVVKSQREDGSWDGDLVVNSWAAEALASARLCGLEGHEEATRRAAAWFASAVDERRDPLAATGYVFLARDRSKPALETAKNVLASAPPYWTLQNYDYWYLGSMAMFQLDAPDGERWRSWNEQLKNTLVPTQDPSGSWTGAGTVQNALATLTLEIYYRYKQIAEK